VLQQPDAGRQAAIQAGIGGGRGTSSLIILVLMQTTSEPTDGNITTRRHDVWLGTQYGLSGQRILVLGESWYGGLEPLSTFIPRWARKEERDYTYSRLFNACSGHHTSKASAAARLAWWQTIAFANFVEGSIGPTRDTRPSRAQFSAAAIRLPLLLTELMPTVVWILGIEQSGHSQPVISSAKIAIVTSPLPAAYGIRTSRLQSDWSKVQLLATS
jgi:hypothetical protein